MQKSRVMNGRIVNLIRYHGIGVFFIGLKRLDILTIFKLVIFISTIFIKRRFNSQTRFTVPVIVMTAQNTYEVKCIVIFVALVN